MIIVDFKDENYKRVTGLWQWDYGQVLRIQGLNLPKAVEIHFSLQESGGEAKKRVGFTKDGVTDVVIPESMLENEEAIDDYNAYAFVYLTGDTSGQTEYKICMPVKARPKPEAFDKPEDEEIFREAIKAVNDAACRSDSSARSAAEHAEQTKADAQKTTADRQEVEKLVESVSGIGEQVETVKEYKDQAQTAASNAVLSEQASEQAKEAALQAQAGAETAEGKAEQHALEVAGDKAEVERLATQVRQDKSSVEQTVQEFGRTVQQAEQSINTAKTKAVEAVNTTKSNAVKAVQTEGEKQAQAVKAKGQEVINSIPSDFTTQMQSKIDKQQGAENAGKPLIIGDDGNVVPGEVQGGGNGLVGEVLLADYTHQGNPEFHFSDFDFATGIGTTAEPHGLTTATSVLICPNDFEVTNFTKNVMTLPIEWTMTGTGISDQLQLVPVDDTHLKLVAKKTQEIIPVNLEDISNKMVDITKFHFEKAILYHIKNLDNEINTKYIKVKQFGYCGYIGNYRYRKVHIRKEDGSVVMLPNYINTLGFSFAGNAPAKNGVLQASTMYIDIRNNVHYEEDLLVFSRRAKYSSLVFDQVKLLNNYNSLYQLNDIKPKTITEYQTYANDYAYMSNGTRIQIYALEGEYKNES